jgi:hypothetical protein
MLVFILIIFSYIVTVFILGVAVYFEERSYKYFRTIRDIWMEMKYDYPIIFFPGINVILLAAVLILHVLDCIFKVTRIYKVWGFIRDGWNNFLDKPIKY